MNKKEAIAYGIITLDYMQSSKYNGELNIDNFSIEMKQAFKMYPRNLVVDIAKSKIETKRRLNYIKGGAKNG